MTRLNDIPQEDLDWLEDTRNWSRWADRSAPEGSQFESFWVCPVCECIDGHPSTGCPDCEYDT